MHQALFPPLVSGLLIHVRNRLFPSQAATVELDRPWIFDDRCQLRFEPVADHLVTMLDMPELHLDLQQLTGLLTLPAQGWPLPLAASLCPQTLQPVLFIHLPLARLDEDLLLRAIKSLQQARQRWLSWPASAVAGHDRMAP